MQAGGNVYMASFHAASWTNSGSSAELFYLLVANTGPIQILEARVGQIQYVDTDDSQSFGLWIACASGAASGGTSVTPIAMDDRTAASGTTASYLATTVASGGTTNKRMEDTWNILSPFVYQPVEDARPSFEPSSHVVFRIVPLSGSSKVFTSSLWASIVWEELA